MSTHGAMDVRSGFSDLVSRLVKEIVAFYGDRLVTIAVFGSVARKAQTPDSDLDVLIVVRPLPRGRWKRIREFESVEARIEPLQRLMIREGIHAEISPIIKTPEEVERGSPLFLDMTHSVDILFDQGGFFSKYLTDLRERMKRLGSRRVRLKGGYYWLLKPDIRFGEDVEL